MRFTSSMILAAGCVGLLALSVPAFGQPTRNNAEQSPKTQSQRADQKNKTADRAAKGKTKKPAAREARLPSAPIAQPPKRPAFGWPVLVSEARKYLGTNPTNRSRLWCATFMNMVLAKVGYTGTNSDAAKSFAQYGRRISEPKVGAIAVLTRGKNGGHVGVVSGIDANGNPIIISGNHGRRVGEAIYPRTRVIAYVMPSEARAPNIQVAGRDTPNRSSAETPLESPIAELLAAIEAEQNRPERPRAPAATAQAQTPAQVQATVQREPVVPQRVVEQLSAAPRRVVQQTPELAAQPRATRRDLPLDPALARFLGIKGRS